MTYKVIQYATGVTGRLTLKTLFERPDMKLVGLGVTSAAKVGKDAGEIAGGAPTNVLATNDIDALCAMEADAVLHMPLPSALMGDGPRHDEDVICKFLASGKNVITTVGYVYPKAYGPDAVARIEAACRQGKSSLHGTGFNPGFVSDVIPATLLSMSARVDNVFVQDISDFALHPSASFVQDYLGFGVTPGQFAERAAFVDYSNALFSESVMMLADCLGSRIDEIKPSLECHLATEDLNIASGVIRKGTVSATCGRWQAVVGGRTLIDVWLIYRARGGLYARVGAGWRIPLRVPRCRPQSGRHLLLLPARNTPTHPGAKPPASLAWVFSKPRMRRRCRQARALGVRIP